MYFIVSFLFNCQPCVCVYVSDFLWLRKLEVRAAA